MSNLRQAAQQALEALIPLANAASPNERECLTDEDHERAAEAVEALCAALAEPDSDYERGFVDGMNLQTKGSVDKAVNRIAEPEQEPVAWLYRDAWGTMKLSQTLPPPVGAFPVYTAPTPRRPLTDEEIGKIAGDTLDAWSCARAIEKAHGIGEQT